MTTHREVLDNVSIRNEIYRSTPSIYPAFGKFAEAFGLRVHPVTGRRDMHRGVDISNDIGTPIYATQTAWSPRPPPAEHGATTWNCATALVM
jgi:murein DD-endopeptidase MepM/ murein hydrolase activator NlpD